jgi:YegS/Rv2252/BmrU family lipid kinase
MKTIGVVINPIAGGGRGETVWQILYPGLKALFDSIDYRISNKVDDLAMITRTLLERKPDYLLIIGGDGTLNQAINGLVVNDQLAYSKMQIAFYNAGSGGDFIRLFPTQRPTEFLERLSTRQSVQSNIGKITFADKTCRYFINISSCGISGEVVVASNKSRWIKKLGGAIKYFYYSLVTLLKYKSQSVRIQIDDNPAFECKLLVMAICNGKYFGGHMHVAPMARIDDGLFDVVLFRDFTKLEALFQLRKIYTANHLLLKHVHYVQAKKVSIEPIKKSPIFVEADGELVGQLPAKYELLPVSIQLIV